MYKNNLTKMENLQGRFEAKKIRRWFYPKQTKELMNLKELPKKNALVLIGPDCSGKTTFSEEHKRQNEKCEILSIDGCYEELYKELCESGTVVSEQELETMVIDIIDAKLVKCNASNVSIIIDGCWDDMRSRAALFKTLSDCGFKICIVHMNPSLKTVKEMITRRAIFLIAQDMASNYVRSKKVRTDVEVIKYPVKFLSRISHISEQEIEKKIIQSDLFNLELHELCNHYMEQYNEFKTQQEAGILYAGADFKYLYSF